MTKADLINLISEKAGITRVKAETVVNTIFDSMVEALMRDDRIEIRGFGSFVNRQYGAYKGRNPRTGEIINVDEPHPREQRFRAAPLFQQHARTGLDRHAIPRQHLDSQFQIRRISDLQQREAGGHDARAFLKHPQNPAAHRRGDRERLDAARRVLPRATGERGSGLL